MSEIHASVNDQQLKLTKLPTIASGGVNEVKVIFTFSEQWEGFIKTALFYRSTETMYYAVLDDNDTCILPWEVYAEDGTFYMSVFGDKESTRRTSTIVRYKVGKGIIAEEMIPSEPTPDVYAQIIEQINSGMLRGQQGEPGKDGYTPVKGVDYFDGKDGRPGDKGEPGAKGEKGDKGDKGDTGAQGEKGDTGAQGIQGEPGLVWRGEYDHSGRYSVGDAVSYKGSSYICTYDSTPTAPDEPDADWELLAEKGYTPVKGTDYWTDADKAEIKAYVDTAILGGVW